MFYTSVHFVPVLEDEEMSNDGITLFFVSEVSKESLQDSSMR